MNDDDLRWLDQYFFALCDDYWEHSHGVKINRSDNPQWSIKIEMTETQMQGRGFERLQPGQTSGDLAEWRRTGSWWVARVEDDTFDVARGPPDLSAAISAFWRWVDASASRIVRFATPRPSSRRTANHQN
jgi:hypothetical protein